MVASVAVQFDSQCAFMATELFWWVEVEDVLLHKHLPWVACWTAPCDRCDFFVRVLFNIGFLPCSAILNPHVDYPGALHIEITLIRVACINMHRV